MAKTIKYVVIVVPVVLATSYLLFQHDPEDIKLATSSGDVSGMINERTKPSTHDAKMAKATAEIEGSRKADKSTETIDFVRNSQLTNQISQNFDMEKADSDFHYNGDKSFKTVDISKRKRDELINFMENDKDIERPDEKQNFVMKSLSHHEKLSDFQFKSASCKEHLCHLKVAYLGTQDGQLARSHLNRIIFEYQENFSVGAVSTFSEDEHHVNYDVFFQPRFRRTRN